MTDQLLEQILLQLKEMKSDIKELKVGQQRIMDRLDSHHIENINADNLLLKEIKNIKLDIDFLQQDTNDNRKEIFKLKNKPN